MVVSETSQNKEHFINSLGNVRIIPVISMYEIDSGDKIVIVNQHITVSQYLVR